MDQRFLSRDLSWLSFNGRVLEEAARPGVPLIERFRFLSIFSSNLDEFYRVRMPAILLMHKTNADNEAAYPHLLRDARQMIQTQQQYFGRILTTQLIPALQQQNIELIYNKALPAGVDEVLKAYFQAEAASFLQVIRLSKETPQFFTKSNALYLAVVCENKKSEEEIFIVNIPSDKLSRFFSITLENVQYIIFLDDIIKKYLPLLFNNYKIRGAWNIKITRDAELDLADEYEGDLAVKIERQLSKRDDGSPTRFLYQPGMSEEQLQWLMVKLNLQKDDMVEGGYHHNLKDLSSIPVKFPSLNYSPQPALSTRLQSEDYILAGMQQRDAIVHTPYQSYQTVLRFFNEAATDNSVKEIYTTLYRVAGDSRIVNALITAAGNGKKVTVFIELKARFDEENNIRWSKRMKAAGITIINSIPGLKVHAKIALLKKKDGDRLRYYGLLATGNLNEITARFYTDHILLTTQTDIVRELELLFIFLSMRRKPLFKNEIAFKHLLVAQFNLQDRFLAMIDTEINHAKQGKPAGIIIKMNNLEERVLIGKLYEASQAGVRIQMIVRSICCLEAGVAGMSENISVVRIVDRYLEHGRVFVFHNNGDEKIFLGSADWMNRNIYRRIEVCFPVYDETIKSEIKHLLQLQLADNTQAVKITAALDNEPIQNDNAAVQSQMAIYQFLDKQKN